VKTFEPAHLATMGRLVDSAATMLQAHFPCAGPVPFDFLLDGQRLQYFARLEWTRGDREGPRVVVLDISDGVFVCQSLPGKPFTIDPADWEVDKARAMAINALVAACNSRGNR
jgi:hypothetical protein